MTKLPLVLALILVCSAPLFAQQDSKKITANFQYNWNEYLLPESSFLIYHGSDESYFLDSRGKRVPNHSYLDIKTGGKQHFIIQDSDGFHILDTNLVRVTETAYDNIELNFGSELELTLKENTSYYAWSYESKSYKFTDIGAPPAPWSAPSKRTYGLKLGEVNDSRFRAKQIEKLRLGIDMTQTLTVGRKGKKVLIKKNDEIVFKGSTKPMLFYDFMITGSKGPHSIYHPISKDPILENCDRFWFVGSTLIVSVKGTPRKHIISNSGEIVLSSAGEIRYYDYKFGGHQYSYFCDGRSIINHEGNQLFRSDGELIGVGEHYIYSGHSGGFLGSLSHNIKKDCTNFKRFGILTVGQTGKNSWRLYDPKSILINQFNDYFYVEKDSLLICTTDSKTIVCNPYSGKDTDVFPGSIRAQQIGSENKWKFYTTKPNLDNTILEGRFDPTIGTLIDAKYLKIEWPESEKYYIVVTEKGLIRYLNSKGQELFD